MTPIVQVAPARTEDPLVQVPPVTANEPPAAPTLVTIGVAVNVIVPPAMLVTVTVPLCGVVVPVTSDGLGAEKATVVPVPVREAAWAGAPPPVSVTVRVAVRAPVALGVNVTRIVQLVDGASVTAVQLLVEMAKLPAFGPVIGVVATVIGPTPVFL